MRRRSMNVEISSLAATTVGWNQDRSPSIPGDDDADEAPTKESASA
jgi:hypothetical protein